MKQLGGEDCSKSGKYNFKIPDRYSHSNVQQEAETVPTLRLLVSFLYHAHSVLKLRVIRNYGVGEDQERPEEAQIHRKLLSAFLMIYTAAKIKE